MVIMDSAKNNFDNFNRQIINFGSLVYLLYSWIIVILKTKLIKGIAYEKQFVLYYLQLNCYTKPKAHRII